MTTDLFLRVTQKLYDLVQVKKTKGMPYFSDLDMKLDKSYFDENEWNFLLKEQDNFNVTFSTIEETKTYPIYKIEDDCLLTNKVNIIGIRSKYSK